MTGRKPSRRETLAGQAEVAQSMREWLIKARDARDKGHARDEKARLLAGDVGGGSGVTLDMKRISMAAQAKPRERVYGHKDASPNRAARRIAMQRKPRVRTLGRLVVVGGREQRSPGRWRRPMPSGHNQAYVRPRDTPAGDDA